MKMILRRRGQFVCHWKSAENKCASGDNLHPKYTYEVKLVLKDAARLDSHGFLMDQLGLDKYFQLRYIGVNGGHEPKSCEVIARIAVLDIIDLFVQERGLPLYEVGDFLEKVSVTIGAGTPASMTAEWEL